MGYIENKIDNNGYNNLYTKFWIASPSSKWLKAMCRALKGASSLADLDYFPVSQYVGTTIITRYSISPIISLKSGIEVEIEE